MPAVPFLAIPCLVAILVGGAIFWTFPEALPFWRSLGIVLGWGGCGLLLASLLLMVREARLARWLGGLERMYRWHHGTGVVAYLCLLAHPLALAAGAWEESPRLAWQTLSPWSESWPVWAGWCSLLLLMAGLAATFRRGLGYRIWRGLHGLLGVAVLVGLGHLVLLGLSAPILAALILAVAFLGWRLVRVDFGSAARPYTVAAVRPVARDMVEIALTPLAEPIAAQVGQFVLVAFLRGEHFRGCGEFHPFTLSAVDPPGRLRIGVKAMGDCTRHIQAIEPGVAVRVQGPFGVFLDAAVAAPQFWIAGGIGITPFLAALRGGMPAQSIRLLYLYRHDADAAFVDELQAIAAQEPGLTLRLQATGDGIPDLRQWLPEAADLVGYECYLCGPPALVAALRPLLEERGLAGRHLHFESFDFR